MRHVHDRFGVVGAAAQGPIRGLENGQQGGLSRGAKDEARVEEAWPVLPHLHLSVPTRVEHVAQLQRLRGRAEAEEEEKDRVGQLK